MSETSGKPGIEREGARSPAPGRRTAQAGGEFFRALGSDLAVVASRLKPRRRVRQPRTPAARPVSASSASWGPGRLIWRFFIVLLGLGSIFTGALCAVLLWVLLGSPVQSPKNDTEIPGSRVEAAAASSGLPAPAVATAKAADAGPDFGRAAALPVRPEAQSGASSAAAEPAKPAKETQTALGAGADQPQLALKETPDHGPPAPQPGVAATLTDLRAPGQCDIVGCAARYRSFHAADCTYQPYGGGPRQICEADPRSAEATPHPQTDTSPEAKAKDTPVAAASAASPAAPARGGQQCNIELCAATYHSFRSADCSYSPYGGGPRRTCELGARSTEPRPGTEADAGSDAKAPAKFKDTMEAKETTVGAKDATVEEDDSPMAEGSSQDPDTALPARAGQQCDVQLCAARYRSFHAADCTYEPYGGGPRRTCER